MLIFIIILCIILFILIILLSCIISKLLKRIEQLHIKSELLIQVIEFEEKKHEKINNKHTF